VSLDPLEALAEVRASRAPADRPFVTLSYAQSLDGSIAAADGRPLQLSGPESLELTHRLRANHNSILVGIGTLLADDPRLTVRLVPGDQPQPVVVDTHLRTPASARVFRHPRHPWIAGAEPFPKEERLRLLKAGAELLAVRPSPEGRLDLDDLLRTLAERGLGSVLVEGGSRILHAFLFHQLVDWVVVTIAPRFSAGKPALDGDGSQRLPSLTSTGMAASGPDVLVWGKPTWRPA